MNKYPRVGIGTIITYNNKVLLGKRKNSHGTGCWCFPGGHLEYSETFVDCAIRETYEETGLKIENIQQIALTNDFFVEENKHYITIFMQATVDQSQVQLKEPDKCEYWQWFDWNDLPSPLFLPIKNLLLQKYNPFKQGKTN
ncbi:MAG: NUDIX hydrolase [Spirochaetes bacterium]|nr:NUDIX hydrolase [Spirochaetota bacterium]